MNNDTNVRESVVLSFVTHLDKIRTLNIPDPRPVLGFDDVMTAAGRIIASNIFDPGMGSGELRNLERADRQLIESTVLF